MNLLIPMRIFNWYISKNSLMKSSEKVKVFWKYQLSQSVITISYIIPYHYNFVYIIANFLIYECLLFHILYFICNNSFILSLLFLFFLSLLFTYFKKNLSRKNSRIDSFICSLLLSISLTLLLTYLLIYLLIYFK